MRLAALTGSLRGSSDRSVAGRIAGAAFLIRAGSAGALYATQVFLARWMGPHEFGIYIYVSAWLLLLGDLVPLGLSTLAQRFIPEYRTTGASDRLRGFLFGSRAIVLAAGSVAGLIGAATILALRPYLDEPVVIPLLIVCAALPFHGLTSMLDGIAGSFGWVRIALLPPYLLKPILIFVLMGGAHVFGLSADAVTAASAAFAATAITAIAQFILVRSALRGVVPEGPRTLDTKAWLNVSLPVLVLRGLYTLIACTDVLVLQHFRAPDEIALYYAAAKAVALVSFITFAVGRGVDYKFAEYHTVGDRDALRNLLSHAVGMTFWPSLAATALILALGRPFLALFGPDFGSAYPLMFLLAIGLLARASVGPAERLLTTLGEQRICALSYAVAFLVCLGACLLLVPRFGTVGAAISTSTAMVVESALLVWAARQRLGLRSTVLFRRQTANRSEPARSGAGN